VQGGPIGDLKALGAHARLVEELGYEQFFTSDHIGAPGSDGRRGAMLVGDPFLPLIVAAEATTHLKLGTMVLNNEFYNPALLARTAANANRLTGCRLVLGVGTGYSSAEHNSIGQTIRTPGPIPVHGIDPRQRREHHQDTPFVLTGSVQQIVDKIEGTENSLVSPTMWCGTPKVSHQSSTLSAKHNSVSR